MSRQIKAAAVALYAVSAAPNAVTLAFKDFVAKYGRVYSGPEEEATRFNIFENKFQFIQSENAKGHPYFLVVNEFSDQAPEEFKSTRLGMRAPPMNKTYSSGVLYLGTDLYSGAPLPDSIDWVEKGAVTKPKNQGTCGSCWSFSTTGALEGAWQIKTGNLVSMSEQMLVDCSTENSGCKGGSMDSAFTFLETKNVCTEESYPYNGQDSTNGNTCEASSCKIAIPKGGVTGFYDVPADDTNALMEAVAQQPVSIAIEADQDAFQQYGGGVLTKECGTAVDHGVLVVGYGTDNGVDYWKVKNSWGPTWGENGFVRIERGLPGAGECGIKTAAVYPKVASSGPMPPSPAPTPTPAPPTPTPPAPSPPTPPSGCSDSKTFCIDRNLCKLFATDCKKTCGCCDDAPPSWCKGPEAETIVV